MSKRTIGEEFQILKDNAMDSLKPLGEILTDLAKQSGGKGGK